MRDFEGRVAVITGAASGIGRAVAHALADEGCDLALADINEEGLAEASEEVTRRGRKASTHVIDVSDRDQMRAFPEIVLGEHGRIDVLVNNAGVSVMASLAEHTMEDFDWLVGINFWGVVHGCKFFLPYLEKSDDAYIVNLSSMFGLMGVPGQSSYCATKFAVRGFSEAIAAELAEGPVRVMSVHPGGIRTNIVTSSRIGPSHEALFAKIADYFSRKAMPPERAAAQIVAGMRSGSSRVLITAEARVTDVVKRLFPVLPRAVLARANNLIGRL